MDPLAALISLMNVLMQNGATKIAVIVMRKAAITREGASRWAKRINNEAAETARMPIKSTIRGDVALRGFTINEILHTVNLT
ncbi:hypothetical protein SDC9_151492 [bioreactor metagenome]|uniref:Uncharacterized protein n=1 Tax=bioreactor metagenome TaxID=1076179 RepID=A0A645ES32_9ZZZZ